MKSEVPSCSVNSRLSTPDKFGSTYLWLETESENSTLIIMANYKNVQKMKIFLQWTTKDQFFIPWEIKDRVCWHFCQWLEFAFYKAASQCLFVKLQRTATGVPLHDVIFTLLHVNLLFFVHELAAFQVRVPDESGEGEDNGDGAPGSLGDGPREGTGSARWSSSLLRSGSPPAPARSPTQRRNIVRNIRNGYQEVEFITHWIPQQSARWLGNIRKSNKSL